MKKGREEREERKGGTKEREERRRKAVVTCGVIDALSVLDIASEHGDV